MNRLALMLVARCAWACVIVHPVYETGPDFEVGVVENGKPLTGLQVDLSPGYRAMTGADGIARFHAIRPGSYSLRDGSGVTVVPSGPRRTISLDWFGMHVLPTRSLQGKFELHYDFQSGPVDLINAITDKLVRSAEIGPQGEFDFHDAKPGFYFLRSKEIGTAAVAVDPSAATDHLEIAFSSTDCGLMYLDQSLCPKTNLRVGRFQGRVVDALGASVRATISLQRGSEAVLRMSAGDHGRFDSNVPPGTYDATIAQLGFIPLRARVTIDPSEPNRELFAELQIGVEGCVSLRFK